jgi:hypothetical protein
MSSLVSLNLRENCRLNSNLVKFRKLIFLGVGCHGEWRGGFHSLHVLVHVHFMRVFCSSRKGRAWGGGGGGRAGGEESSANKIRAVGAEADTRHLA